MWLSVYSEVQTVCIWSSWCHCHLKTSSSIALFKSRLAYPGCPGKQTAAVRDSWYEYILPEMQFLVVITFYLLSKSKPKAWNFFLVLLQHVYLCSKTKKGGLWENKLLAVGTAVIMLVTNCTNNLGHGLFIWLFLWICPVNNDVTAPDACVTIANAMLCHWCRFMTVVLQKRKAAIFLLNVIRRIIDDHVCYTVCQQQSSMHAT